MSIRCVRNVQRGGEGLTWCKTPETKPAFGESPCLGVTCILFEKAFCKRFSKTCFFFGCDAGDYVKLNSPPDSLLEDSDSSFEMREMNRPAPPKTLALNSSTAFNSSAADVRSASSTKAVARAASAGRAPAMGRANCGGGGGGEYHPVKECSVYLLGGTERDGSVTVFKKPMSVWKLSMFFRNVQ